MKTKNNLIAENPKVLGGIPVIKGTRIPASLLASLVKKGYPNKLISIEYPSLSIQKIVAFRTLLESGSHVFETK